MTPLAGALAGLAVLLAGPVPARLRRARWPARDPWTALLCWQALGLAGGWSIVTALVVYGLAPWGCTVPDALSGLIGGTPAAVGADRWVALAAGLALLAELLVVLAFSGGRTLRRRRRTRALLDLLVRRDPATPEAVVLDSPVPAAFCLPGSRPLLVLSSAALDRLPAPQLAAVIAHERAHLAERHDVLLLPFVAWRTALPRMPAPRRAYDAVRELMELRADDLAVRRGHHPRALAAAVVGVAGGAAGHPVLAGGGGGSAVPARVTRLLRPPAPLARPVRVAVRIAAAALVVLPPALLALPALT